MYSHTQTGWLTIIALVVPIIVIGAAGVNLEPESPARGGLLATQIFLALLVPLFGWLTVTVNDETVTAKFGVGLIRKKLRIRDIQSATRVRNKWYYGWGIRMGPEGWIYNVSGLDAVEIALKGGGKFRIGTDEAEELARVIKQRIVI